MPENKEKSKSIWKNNAMVAMLSCILVGAIICIAMFVTLGIVMTNRRAGGAALRNGGNAAARYGRGAQ